MKLVLFIVLLTTFQVQAMVSMAQNLNLSMKGVEMKKVLSAIEKQSTYRFMYNYNLNTLNRKVDFYAQNMDALTALDRLFEGSGLTYRKVSEKLIAIVELGEASAKEIVVRGTVMDENGVPLAGVSVMIKGSSVGTITNTDGSFTIAVPNANSVLIFTSVGFADLEQVVGSRNEINVVLLEKKTDLEQVVVIGYGTQKRKELTGTISTVQGAELEKLPNSNPISS